MKAIPVDKIESIAATSVNENYPATNLSNNIRTSLFKADTFSTTLTIRIGANSNGFSLANCNADSITATLNAAIELDLDTGVDLDTGLDLYNPSAITLTEIDGLDGTSNGHYFCSWTAVETPTELVLVLSNSSTEVLYAGIARAGVVQSIRNAEYGMSESYDDTSIVNIMSDKSTYIKDRELLRKFSLKINQTRDTQFHNFIINILKVVKSNPIIWVVTDESNARWIVFARFTKLPKGSHFTYNRTMLSFELTEVV